MDYIRHVCLTLLVLDITYHTKHTSRDLSEDILRGEVKCASNNMAALARNPQEPWLRYFSVGKDSQ